MDGAKKTKLFALVGNCTVESRHQPKAAVSRRQPSEFPLGLGMHCDPHGPEFWRCTPVHGTSEAYFLLVVMDSFAGM